MSYPLTDQKKNKSQSSLKLPRCSNILTSKEEPIGQLRDNLDYYFYNNNTKFGIILVDGYIYNYLKIFKHFDLNLPKIVKTFIENNSSKFKELFLFQKEGILFNEIIDFKIILFCKYHTEKCSGYCNLIQNIFKNNIYKIYSDIDILLTHFPEAKYSNICPPSKIYDNLYLGDETYSYNENFIIEKNIKNILTLVETPCKLITNNMFKFIKFKHINIQDDYYTKISDYFLACIDFIKQAHNNNECVYVHCAKGISRSVSIIIAFIMKDKKMKYSDAFNYVKQCRTIAQPNYYFITQLLEFEKTLFET